MGKLNDMLVAGGLLLLITIVFVGDMLWTRWSGQRAPGTVSGMTTVRGSSYPEIAFADARGQRHTFTAPFSFRVYRTGEAVEVAYRDAEPAKALVIRPLWQEVFWLPGLIILFVSVKLIQIGLRRRRQLAART